MWVRRLLLGVACVVTVLSCASVRTRPALRVLTPTEGPRYVRDPARRARLEDALPALDAYLRTSVASQEIPGLAFALVLDGEPVLVKGYGVDDVDDPSVVDDHTVFRIASLTKPVTATAVLALRDGERIALDDAAVKHVPELDELVYPTSDASPITLRQLLSHSSGLPRSAAADTTDEASFLRSLGGLGTETVPGTHAAYSNLGYSLLGIVASRAARQPFRSLVEEELLRPLGMDDARWDPPSGEQRLAVGYRRDAGGLHRVPLTRLGAGEASGGLFASVTDMARFAAFHLSAWPPRSAPDKGPVKRSTLRESHALSRPSFLELSDEGEQTGAAAGGYGLGFRTFEDCSFEQVLWHDGQLDGYSAATYLLPQRGVAVVALANVEDARVSDLADGALRLLEPHLPRRALLPSSALARAVSSVASAVSDPAPDGLAASLRGRYPEHLDPEAIATVLRGVHDRHGACRPHEAARIDAPSAGVFTLACDRGQIDVEIAVDSAPEPRIVRLRVRDAEAEGDALGAIAARIPGLIAEYQEGTAHQLLDEGVRRGATRRYFAALGRTHGSCRLDGAGFRSRPETASYVLACDRGKLLLEVSVENGRAASLSLTTPPGRCAHAPVFRGSP
jgi:CubicO group peptidase (beta-lactamase class C family)